MEDAERLSIEDFDTRDMAGYYLYSKLLRSGVSAHIGTWGCVEFVALPGEEEILRLYQRAAVFALPSDEEGFGVVILEAMACGVPVVATRCGGPEGIITDGTDGFLVPREDAGAMAARLQVLLDSPTLNETMGRRARATIEARYADEVAGEAFLEVWDGLLKRIDRR